jgi:hypothetical protein
VVFRVENRTDLRLTFADRAYAGMKGRSTTSLAPDASLADKKTRPLAVRSASKVGTGHWAAARGQDSHEPGPVFEGLALPPVLVEIPGARGA